MNKTMKQANKTKTNLSRNLFFDLIFLISILFISIDNPNKALAKILLVFNILFFAYSVFVFVKSYNENYKPISSKDVLFSKAYLLLNLLTLAYIVYSSLSNTNYLVVLMSVVLFIVAISIAYMATRYINKKMENHSEMVRSLAILLVSLLVFAVLVFITLWILTKFKLI